MSFLLRTTRVLSRSTGALTPRLSSATPYSTQGYGDGKGDPKGSDPQAQGSASSSQTASEHPGPAPPSAGKGTGGATKGQGETGHGGQKDPADASASSGGSRSKEAAETGSSPTGGKIGGGKRAFSTVSARQFRGAAMRGAEPKISDKGTPGGKGNEISEEKKREVEQHNKEFDAGHDRVGKTEDQKVDSKTWKGHVTDKEPSS